MGGWSGWGDLGAACGGRNKRFKSVSIANIGKILHICAVTNKGFLLHATGDFAHGGWSGWGDLGAAHGRSKMRFISAGVASIGTDLHTCAVSNEGHLLHGLGDFKDGGWTGLGQITVASGLPDYRYETVLCGAYGKELDVIAKEKGKKTLWTMTRYQDNWKHRNSLVGGVKGDTVTIVGSFVNDIDLEYRVLNPIPTKDISDETKEKIKTFFVKKAGEQVTKQLIKIGISVVLGMTGTPVGMMAGAMVFLLSLKGDIPARTDVRQLPPKDEKPDLNKDPSVVIDKHGGLDRRFRSLKTAFA